MMDRAKYRVIIELDEVRKIINVKLSKFSLGEAGASAN
jgi:hypothetical protein